MYIQAMLGELMRDVKDLFNGLNSRKKALRGWSCSRLPSSVQSRILSGTSQTNINQSEL